MVDDIDNSGKLINQAFYMRTQHPVKLVLEAGLQVRELVFGFTAVHGIALVSVQPSILVYSAAEVKKFQKAGNNLYASFSAQCQATS